MAEQIVLDVSVDGKKYHSVQSVNISQGVFNHHDFQVMVPGDSILAAEGIGKANEGNKNDALFNKIPELIGKRIVIQWKSGLPEGEAGSSFIGIIMDVSVSGQHQDHLSVTLSGKSPTILLDSALNSDTYSEVGLVDLYNTAKNFNLGEELNADDNLSFKGKIPFIVQYNETDFNFMCRIMHEQGEWFYYDGERIQLGFANTSPVKLGKDRIQRLDFTFSATAPVPTLAGWDYLGNEALSVQGEKPSISDGLAAKVHDQSEQLFPGGSKNDVNQPVPSHAEGEGVQPSKEQLQGLMDRMRQGNANETHRITGSSTLASVRLGTVLQLGDFAYSGRYVVTHVSHTCMGKDHYENYFTAVPEDAGLPASSSFTKPRIESTRAKVTDNKDPEKLGRVRVAFEWGAAESPWLRMLVPHAGKDRGFYFVPEVGDEVLVAFEMGWGRAPYVVGGFYNGKNAQPDQFADRNDLKIIRTRSGNELIFDDTDGASVITIRNDKNTIELSCDSDGRLTMTTRGDMVLKADKDFTLEAGGAVKFTSGKDFSIGSAGALKASANKAINVSAGNDLKLETQANVELAAMGNAQMKATGNAEVNATGQLALKGTKTELSASAVTEVKGALVKIN